MASTIVGWTDHRARTTGEKVVDQRRCRGGCIIVRFGAMRFDIQPKFGRVQPSDTHNGRRRAVAGKAREG